MKLIQKTHCFPHAICDWKQNLKKLVQVTQYGILMCKSKCIRDLYVENHKMMI